MNNIVIEICDSAKSRYANGCVCSRYGRLEVQFFRRNEQPDIAMSQDP